MVILFGSKQLQKRCNSLKNAQKFWGDRRGMLVMRRLDEIADSDTLEILIQVHPRCHPLKGDLKGLWSVDLEHPYRLIFEPATDPLPMLKSGGLDTGRVTTVRILKVEDTHGR